MKVENNNQFPLTIEILKKNGFVLFAESSKYTVLHDDKHNISATYWKDSKEWLIVAGPCGSLKKRFVEVSCVGYVHELQHILILCEIDKEIVL